jgi:hypothetical protein
LEDNEVIEMRQKNDTRTLESACLYSAAGVTTATENRHRTLTTNQIKKVLVKHDATKRLLRLILHTHIYIYIPTLLGLFLFRNMCHVYFEFYNSLMQHRNSRTLAIESLAHDSGRTLVYAEYVYPKGSPDTNS